MPRPAPRIFISAGEPSGDLHAGPVAAALRAMLPDASIEALGGPGLRQAGAEVRFPMEQYSVMGFVEAIGKLAPHVALLRQLRSEFRRGRYDLVILVDYPGFNLRLAEAARAAGVPTLYYVAPQLWAWRRGRVRRLARGVSRLAVILPFEADFFGQLGVRADFVGHPLAEHCMPDRAAARQALGLPERHRVLVVFPGSRRQEVDRIWPVFRDAALSLLRAGACDRVLVAGTAAGSYDGHGPLEIVTGVPEQLLAAADAAMVKSGTTTLQAALAGTPMVVAYVVHPVTAMIARRVIRVPWISLVNLVAGRQVVPELVQGEATSARLVAAVAPLLRPESAEAQAQRSGLAEVRDRLGGPGTANRVAAMAVELLA